jgi:hypothetical protein
MNLLEAIGDANLFKRWLGDPSWAPWRAFLGALFGLPMDAEQLAVFEQCTGRTTAPTAAFNEAWLVCGRRGGKSSVLALVAAYLAAFRDYREHLAPRGGNDPHHGGQSGTGPDDLPVCRRFAA